MAKTVHVIPKDGRWAVKREGAKAERVVSTQGEAIGIARDMARRENSGQHDTYGMPRYGDKVQRNKVAPIFDADLRHRRAGHSFT
jgi:hypothetical protein